MTGNSRQRRAKTKQVNRALVANPDLASLVGESEGFWDYYNRTRAFELRQHGDWSLARHLYAMAKAAYVEHHPEKEDIVELCAKQILIEHPELAKMSLRARIMWRVRSIFRRLCFWRRT